jgi:phage tail sheath protein FI
MALTYRAPGVYVEEIPSARQPIAGVGTNTVGFIGAVPNTIWNPVPNPHYDPVLAQALIESRPSRSEEGALRDRRATLQAGLAALSKASDEAKIASESANAAVRTAAEAPTPTDPEAARAAQRTLANLRREAAERLAAQTAAQDALEAAQRDIDIIAGRLGLRPTGTTTGQPPGTSQPGSTTPPRQADARPRQAPQLGEADADYGDSDPDEDLRRSSIFRPYYLVPFSVKAALNDTKLCTNFSEYTARFGDFSAFWDTNESEPDPSKRFQPYSRGHHLLTHAVAGFFANGGTRCFVARVNLLDPKAWDQVKDQLESIEDVALLAAPGLPKRRDYWENLESYCEDTSHQNVFAILDSPLLVEDEQHAVDIKQLDPDTQDPQPKLPRNSPGGHAAFYFPHIEVVDPAKRLQDSDPAWGVEAKYRGRTYVAPSGHVAGIYARTDEERGVHKAPANVTVRGALEVKYYISRPKQDLLNPLGINCIRLMNGDVTVWGARNIGGDSLGEWKYINVRRFAGFLEESIKRGTQWVVFEPNDPNLWSRIILNITAFLTILWGNGALFGLTPQEAFYVKCDEELNPPEVRDLGQVITEIGVAIVRPAEFVIFRITQSAGPSPG